MLSWYCIFIFHCLCVFTAGRSGNKRQDEDNGQTAYAKATNFAGVTSSTGEFARFVSARYICYLIY